MSEDLSKIKEYFIKEYRENGGTEDLQDVSYEILLTKLEAQKEINSLKKELEKTKSAPPPRGTILILYLLATFTISETSSGVSGRTMISAHRSGNDGSTFRE